MNDPENLLRDSLPRKITERYDQPAPGGKPSAVLVLIRVRREGGEVCFIRRSQQLADHSGQISFPGGRADAGEEGPLQTALRETREEIGIPPDAVRPLGILDPVDTSSGFRVWPVIGIAHTPVDPRPSSSEVVETFWIPLSWLAVEGRWERRHVPRPDGMEGGSAVFFEAYKGRVIWGATAEILVRLLELIRGAGVR